MIRIHGSITMVNSDNSFVLMSSTALSLSTIIYFRFVVPTLNPWCYSIRVLYLNWLHIFVLAWYWTLNKWGKISTLCSYREDECVANRNKSKAFDLITVSILTDPAKNYDSSVLKLISNGCLEICFCVAYSPIWYLTLSAHHLQVIWYWVRRGEVWTFHSKRDPCLVTNC